MAAADYYTQVYTMFVGYFGRPPAQSGLDYYANLVNAAGGKLDAVLDDFHKAAESQAQFSGKTIEQQVNIIFQNLFGRDAAPAGLNYWAGEIAAGRLALSQAAYAISQGAQAADKGVLTAKIDSAKLWVAGLDTTNEILAYGNEAGRTAGRDFLKTVTTSTPAAQTAVDAALKSMVDGGSTNPGQTFTLTSSIDTLNGTSGNDTFIADNNTASAADQLTGGSGTDTLKLYDTVTLPTFSGIESLYLNSAGASLDISSKSEITSFTVDNEVTADGVAFKIAAGQAVTLSSITEGTAGHDLNIDSAAAVTSVNLTADKVGTSTTDVDVDIVGGGVTSLDLKSANNASYFSLVNSGGVLATINVSGDKAIAINLDVDSSAGDIDGVVTKVDASAMTAGGVTVTLEDDTAPKNVTFIGGAGNDTVNFGIEFTSDDSATGGEGTDIIGIGDGADLTLASGAKATGFEKLSVVGGTGSYDLDFLSGITGVIAGGGAAAVTIVDLAVGADVTVKAALAGGTLTINQKDAGAGSPDDSLTVTIDAAAGFSTTQDIDVNDIETVTLKTTSAGASQTHTITNLIADEATSIKVEASTAGATFTNLNAAAMVLFDASSSTKAVSLTTNDSFTSTSGVAFKGGAGSDTFTLTAVGDFSSTANAATVIVTGGAGGDAYVLAADDGTTAGNGHTDGEAYTFKFADGDSISVAGAGNGFDTTKTDEISGIDSSTAFDATTDADGNKFTLDTNQTASDKTFSTTAVTFGTTTVANAYDFYVFDNNANTANTAYVYQDTDGDKIIEAGEFAIMITGTAQFTTGEFAVTSGNLVFTSA